MSYYSTLSKKRVLINMLITALIGLPLLVFLIMSLLGASLLFICGDGPCNSINQKYASYTLFITAASFYLIFMLTISSILYKKVLSAYHLLSLLSPIILGIVLYFLYDTAGNIGIIYKDYQYKNIQTTEPGIYTTTYNGNEYKMYIGVYYPLPDSHFNIIGRAQDKTSITMNSSTIFLDKNFNPTTQAPLINDRIRVLFAGNRQAVFIQTLDK